MVAYRKLKVGEKEVVTVKGAPVTWTLSIPAGDADTAAAVRFIRWLLTERGDVLEKNGFRPISRPQFYGPAGAFGPFKDVARYMGELK